MNIIFENATIDTPGLRGMIIRHDVQNVRFFCFIFSFVGTAEGSAYKNKQNNKLCDLSLHKYYDCHYVTANKMIEEGIANFQIQSCRTYSSG